METNTVIIGSGIAGMTAALYLHRAGIPSIIVESSSPGGQILTTSIIENYPGFLEIDGPQFAISVYKQMLKNEVQYFYAEVNEIISGTKKKVITDKGEITCKNIIIATGRSPRKLELSNEDNLKGKGISYCAICDGALYKNKDVAVVGAGNSAFEESIYLSNIASSVTILARSDKFRADEKLVNELKKKDNVKILTNKSITKIIGKDSLEKIEYKDNKNNEKGSLKVDGLFSYIGQVPNTKFLSNLNITNEYGYIVVDKNMETKNHGIYAVGDCTDKRVYQIITASADAAIAATMISRGE